MAEKTLIMLAKNTTAKQRKFPLYLSEKVDGFAYNVMKLGGKIVALSRQNKQFTSVEHIHDALNKIMQNGDRIVGELFIPGMDFKDSGGIIRRNKPDLRIRLGIYDSVKANQKDWPFNDRYLDSTSTIQSYASSVGWLSTEPYMWLQQHMVVNEDALERTEATVQSLSAQPTFEGWMYRYIEHLFAPGKRSWGMQRKTMKGSIDLRVVSVEQAFSKEGEPLGMSGRINVWYPHKDKGKYKETCGVGPGRLTHDQRTRIWNNQSAFIGKIIEIEYKVDPSYAALRQPTFQKLRRDKDTGDNE